MTTVAAPTSAPRNIPGAGLTLVPPVSPLPPGSNRSGRSQFDGPLSPVAQNGSFEFDRIIKEGEVSKRTRKTKVSLSVLDVAWLQLTPSSHGNRYT